MAAQNSILCWASDHRVHHHYVDRDWDPYNIRRGFWWAHFFWIFYKAPDGRTRDNVADLQKNPVVMWQYRWNKFLVLFGVFGIPLAVGAYFGRPIAGLLWGGFLRIALTHHSTFLVNSMAHSVGKPTFAAEVSARDNWVLALATFGEGYHSYHHKFPADFRNGVRWYDWDPAKWLIWALRSVGLATKLRSTAAPVVEQARMHAAVQKLEHKLDAIPTNLGDEIRARIMRAKESVEHAVALWKQHTEERASGASKTWRETRRKCQARLRQARIEWREAVDMLAGLPEAA
jgi:stearoyl-CoA desaturase (delta-9 desaturase)